MIRNHNFFLSITHLLRESYRWKQGCDSQGWVRPRTPSRDLAKELTEGVSEAEVTGLLDQEG